jgi:hypothetical protein
VDSQLVGCAGGWLCWFFGWCADWLLACALLMDLVLKPIDFLGSSISSSSSSRIIVAEVGVIVFVVVLVVVVVVPDCSRASGPISGAPCSSCPKLGSRQAQCRCSCSPLCAFY